MTVKGIVEVSAKLKAAPRLVVLRAFQRALEAGAAPIQAAMVGLAPLGEDGLLKTNSVVKVELDTGGQGGVARIGYNQRKAKHSASGNEIDADSVALWLEYGHRLVGRKPHKRSLGTVPPHPFMRRALETAQGAAVAAFADTMNGILEQD